MTDLKRIVEMVEKALEEKISEHYDNIKQKALESINPDLIYSSLDGCDSNDDVDIIVEDAVELVYKSMVDDGFILVIRHWCFSFRKLLFSL